MLWWAEGTGLCFREAVVSAVAEHRGDAGLPLERALGKHKGTSAAGFGHQSSDAEAEGQERTPGNELQPLGPLFCASSALIVIMRMWW